MYFKWYNGKKTFSAILLPLACIRSSINLEIYIKNPRSNKLERISFADKIPAEICQDVLKGKTQVDNVPVIGS